MPNFDENYFQLTLQLLFPETLQVAVEEIVTAIGEVMFPDVLDAVFQS